VKEDHDLSYLKNVKSKVDCWASQSLLTGDTAKKQTSKENSLNRELQHRSRTSIEVEHKP
jgi:hypothetical protein